jgi:selenocysteine-specific elongation factor
VDASLDVLASIGHPVGRRGAYLVYVGSGEFPAGLRLLGSGSDRIEPGASGLVRLVLQARLPLVPGDRFVLREAGRGETVGGGEVLDVAPVLPVRRARPSRSVERVVAERGWVDAAELARLTGVEVAPTIGRWVADPVALEAARAAVRAAVEEAGPAGLDPASLDEHRRAVLAAGLPGVRMVSGRAVAAGVSGLSPAAAALLAVLEQARWSPPAIAPAERAALRELARHGLVVEAGDAWFAASAVASAREVVAGLLAVAPDGVTVADVRDALGTSRKHVLPLLAHFDASGVTRRRDDVRVAGPRLRG